MRKIVMSGSAVATVTTSFFSRAWAQSLSDTERYVGGARLMSWGAGRHVMIFGSLVLLLFFAIALSVVLARWLGRP